MPINIKPGQQDFDHVMLSLRLLTIIAGFAFTGAASAASIGIVAPQNGPYELLGQQVRQGAKAAAAKLGLDIVEIHESCEDGSGGAIQMVWSPPKSVLRSGFYAPRRFRVSCRP